MQQNTEAGNQKGPGRKIEKRRDIQNDSGEYGSHEIRHQRKKKDSRDYRLEKKENAEKKRAKWTSHREGRRTNLDCL